MAGRAVAHKRLGVGKSLKSFTKTPRPLRFSRGNIRTGEAINTKRALKKKG